MEGLILSSISAEFLILFGFSLSLAQFMTGAFLLFVGVLSDIKILNLMIRTGGGRLMLIKMFVFKK